MQNSAHLAVLISAIIPLISIVSFEADGAELNCLGGKFDRIERSISTPTKNALIRLKLRHSFVNELRGGQPTEKRSFEYKSIFNQTGRADPSKIRNETVTEALFQLTTRIFSPKTGSLPNYYEVLGVDKKATLKQIRDGYYKAAKQWHPDKNKKDPQAEARFKLISEAYEVLGDPEKRKIYDEGGREGLEAHELFKNIDVKAIIRALFGGGEFEDIIGDVCELPMLKHVLRSEEDKEERTYREEKEEMEDEAVESKGGKKDRNVTEDELEKLAAKEEEYCKMLGEKLYNTLRARADAGVSSDDFIKECKEWGRKLCEAPGGMDLVLMLRFYNPSVADR